MGARAAEELKGDSACPKAGIRNHARSFPEEKARQHPSSPF